jgi:homoserine kinase
MSTGSSIGKKINGLRTPHLQGNVSVGFDALGLALSPVIAACWGLCQHQLMKVKRRSRMTGHYVWTGRLNTHYLRMA